jgi:YVTN family beta-propeller protein
MRTRRTLEAIMLPLAMTRTRWCSLLCAALLVPALSVSLASAPVRGSVGPAGKCVEGSNIPDANPNGVATDPRTDRAYIASETTVEVVDGHTEKLAGKIALGSHSDAYGLAVDPLSNTVYATDVTRDRLYVINGQTDQLTTTMTVKPIAAGVAVDPRTDRVYVATAEGDSVLVINGKTSTVLKTIPLGTVSDAVAVDPQTDMIYAANVGGDMKVINGKTDAVVATVGSVAAGPLGLAVNARTDMIFAGTQDRLWAVSGQTDKIVGTLTRVRAVDGVAVDPQANLVYASNDLASFDYVINGRTLRKTSTLRTEPNPSGVAVNPNTEAAYLAGNQYLEVYCPAPNA